MAIVGIGASAGGLEAITQLLHALSPLTGMAFVYVQHLEARHESMLTRLLSTATSMPIDEVRHGARPQPNHVYVIPPNTDIRFRRSAPGRATEGRITFAQEPATAKFDGMPTNAVSAGCVDFVLPPQRIAAEISRISRHPYVGMEQLGEAVPAIPAREDDWLRRCRVGAVRYDAGNCQISCAQPHSQEFY